MIDDPAAEKRFRHLGQRLPPLFRRVAAGAPATVVVVPSLTLHPAELAKIPGAGFFEERLLFALGTLRTPGARVVYVTSQRIDPAIVDYTMELVTAEAGPDARDRLTLLDCADRAGVPLTQKILSDEALIQAIRRAVPDPSAAYLLTYISTPIERDLALALDLPLFACDPRLSNLGTKSSGRQLLRRAGVAIPDGFEDLSSEAALIEALARLRQEHPELGHAVVKLNDSFAGAGNARFSYAGAPEAATELPDWIGAHLRSGLRVPGDTWETFAGKLAAMSGVVEAYVDGAEVRSPSAQLEIQPDGEVRVLSTHEQVLGGATGQTFVGCAFPARAAYRARVRELAVRAATELARGGVLGQLSVDFVVADDDPDRIFALELNLRMGGATAPFMFLDAVVGGRYDGASGEYLARDGRPRYYVASDRIQIERLRGRTPSYVLEVVARAGHAYQRDTQTGAVFYALGAVGEFGKFGLIAIGVTPEDAERRYQVTVELLNRAERPAFV